MAHPIGLGERKLNGTIKRRHQRDVHLGFGYWHDMRRRTSATDRLKNESYADAVICAEWSTFEEFSKWFVIQPRQDGWVLDKDLLSEGQKVYSPDTCCFLPREINQMLVCSRRDSGGFPGVYARGNRFLARVRARNQRIHVGSYSTQKEALSAYLQAKSEILAREAESYRSSLDPRAYAALKSHDFRKQLEK